jgi:hypothetical protein
LLTNNTIDKLNLGDPKIKCPPFYTLPHSSSQVAKLSSEDSSPWPWMLRELDFLVGMLPPGSYSLAPSFPNTPQGILSNIKFIISQQWRH